MPAYTLTPEMLAGFRDELARREKSPATVEKYLRFLHAFARWAGGEVTPEKAASWKQSLSAARAPSTVNGAVAALNAFFAFSGWEGCRLKPLKIQRRVFREDARELSRADFDRLVAAAVR